MPADLHFKGPSPPAPPASAGAGATWRRLGAAAGERGAEARAEGADPAASLRLGERLRELRLLSDDQLEVALLEQKRSGKLLGEILVDFGFITEGALSQVIAESTGRARFDAGTTVVDPDVVQLVPKEIALRHKVLPVAVVGDTLLLAMADVYNVMAIDQVRHHLPARLRIEPLVSTDVDLQAAIDQSYGYQMSIAGILRELETGEREASGGEQEGYVNPTVRLVNAILVDAVKRGASDIHFEPEGAFLRLRYRIDGVMIPVRAFHKDYWPAIAVRIKVISGLDIADSRNPQNGRLSYLMSGREVDFRVASQPTVHGENIVMRILDKARSLLPLEELGFGEANVALLKRLLRRPEGIVFVSGPTGAGKTTTLYSILRYLNATDVNIMTLEDPVEYQLPLIRQANVREDTAMNFAEGIRSMLRQDPDILFIGEVRDQDTGLMALRAAMTGHQVFTTLHSNDAVGVIARLIDIGVPRHLLAGQIICCVAQRLVRILCPECRRPRPARADECELLGGDPAAPPTVHDPVGCAACDQLGYRGRTAIVEILPVTDDLDELIASGGTRTAMLASASRSGFRPIAEDGIDKVLAGLTSVEAVARAVNLTGRR
ncbi:MAG TPA: ATPase, T2SS/T4P/T4SS family [Alphaproteobacteria bacterium]